ncbi:MAG: hypothetical protein MR866_02045 [Selenomonadaceae bacterium]|nr:hypothetical protein [Selenomonadaceae bacterium]
MNFDKLYPWKGIETVTIDGQQMVRIPKFYLKVAALTSGVHAGQRAYLISDVAREGYHIHPAFMSNGKEMDCFYYGAYEASMAGYPNGDHWDSTGKQRSLTGPKACSLPNVHVWNYVLPEFARLACEARNTGTGEQAGWHIQNVYEVNAVAILMLVEYGTTDMMSAIGYGCTVGHGGHVFTTTGNPYGDDYTVLTGTTDAVWRGIHELWGNCWEHYYGITTDTSGVVQILANDGSGVYVSTGQGFPSGVELKTDSNAKSGRQWANGYMADMHTETGAKFNLGDIFFPSKAVASQADGTYHDLFVQRANDYYNFAANVNYDPTTRGYCHGSFDCGADVGPFIFDVFNGRAGANNGFRLAKLGTVS